MENVNGLISMGLDRHDDENRSIGRGGVDACLRITLYTGVYMELHERINDMIRRPLKRRERSAYLSIK